MMQKQSIERVDIVIPVKTDIVWLFVNITLPFILKNLPYRKILILTHRQNFSKITGADLEILDEDQISQGLTLRSVHDYLESRGANVNRSGWYFQQFLKFAIAQTDKVGSKYLVWDADCVPLRKIPIIENGKVLIDTTTEHHQPYFDTIDKLWSFQKQVDFSFIAEHFLFEKSLVLKLLDDLLKERERERDRFGGVLFLRA
ncbi:DUF6492 family protein [Helicobacter suis]|uniref:DUF6492 family protein n=1 Tax=Helicobacter suis TaxID=104628 RepID=UPI0013D20971|nr:DUF6492 family protein [Helicobacter suis]